MNAQTKIVADGGTQIIEPLDLPVGSKVTGADFCDPSRETEDYVAARSPYAGFRVNDITRLLGIGRNPSAATALREAGIEATDPYYEVVAVAGGYTPGQALGQLGDYEIIGHWVATDTNNGGPDAEGDCFTKTVFVRIV